MTGVEFVSQLFLSSIVTKTSLNDHQRQNIPLICDMKVDAPLDKEYIFLSHFREKDLKLRVGRRNTLFYVRWSETTAKRL